MNMKRWMVLAPALAVGLGLPTLLAQESETTLPSPPKRTGRINGSNVNVRGKPTINSEVVVQLQNGDSVTIYEEITRNKLQVGEPEKWLRIALPSKAAVWIHSSFIDPTTKAVKASRLNLRSGPGENFSVLGRIPMGTVVKDVETRGDWLKIEPPADTFAFVAANLVTPDPATALVEATPTEPPPEPATDTVPEPTPAIAPTNAAPPAIAEVTEVEMAATPIVAPPPPPIDSAPVEPSIAEPQPVTDPAAIEPSVLTVPEGALMIEVTVPSNVDLETMLNQPDPSDIEPPQPPPKRIVHREGIVRRSSSIQAPTYFVLQSVDNRRTINYLHSPATNIVLTDFYGARVLVTGEELLDERWPNVPVINIETLETVP